MKHDNSQQRATRLERATFSLEGCDGRVPNDDGETSYDSSDNRLASSLADSAQHDPDLAAIVTAWPELPEAIRARIMGLVEGASMRPK